MKPPRRSTTSRRGRNNVKIKRISLVGAGAVGSTLTALLFEKGYEIVSIINRTAKPALALAKAVKCKKVSTSIADISSKTDLLLLAVPDDALVYVAREYAKHLRGQKLLAVHTSGVHSLDVLKPLQRKGAVVASLHPIQSLPKAKNLRERMRSVQGISFGIEGEGRALEIIQRIVRSFGGRSVVIPKGLKPLYHVACVFASNYVITLLNAVAEVSKSLGLDHQWREMILPLFTTTVEHALRASPKEALTGPIVRNDVHTIELHLEALLRFAPQLLPVYSVLGIETARIARQHGMLTSEQFHTLVSTIRKHIKLYLKNR